MKRIERQFLKPVYQALNSQVLYFVEQYAKSGVYADSYVSSEEVKNQIENIYRKVIPFIYRRTKKSWTDDVEEFISYFLMNMSVILIANYTRKLILSVIRGAEQQGVDQQEIIRRIMDLTKLNRFRAEQIVRTEVLRSVNFAILLNGYHADYLYTKEWVAVSDFRTRRTHRHTSGEVKDLMEPFSNGLMFPGDPMGPAKEVINCRCVIKLKVKRDANGRPLPNNSYRGSAVQQLYYKNMEVSIATIINQMMNETL